MTNKLELPIGTKSEVFGVMVKCVEAKIGCVGCEFSSSDYKYCKKISCKSFERFDYKNIILRKV